MAIKALKKPVITKLIKQEKDVEKFISKGGSLATPEREEGDHRLTLRIPNWLMKKVDEKRKQRVGTVSRNFWILEMLEKATKN